MSGFVRTAKSAATGKRIVTKLYRAWGNMRARCNCQTTKKFHRYGGRGISVCAEWGDYAVFRAWALANGFSKGLTLDRIDVNGNYEPANCQWITRSENSSKDCRGVNHSGAKLTEKQVREIRASTGSQIGMARKYEVSGALVSLIKLGKKWSHIQ